MRETRRAVPVIRPLQAPPGAGDSRLAAVGEVPTRRPIDGLSLLGLAVALGAVFLGQHLEGGTWTSLVNGPALLIVLGGSLGATMLQSPWPVFVRALRLSTWILRPPRLAPAALLEQVLAWAGHARHEGVLGLERVAAKHTDPYLRKALQLLIDGADGEQVRNTLELACHARERRDLAAARVLESMGGYAPTLGILGAVIGLIQVMHNLADPTRLGAGIAVAFVATVYGVGFANLVFLPAANKIKALVRERSRVEEMVAVGVIAIADGEHLAVIERRLRGLAT